MVGLFVPFPDRVTSPSEFPENKTRAYLGASGTNDEGGMDLGRVVTEGGNAVPKGLFVWVLLSIHCQ